MTKSNLILVLKSDRIYLSNEDVLEEEKRNKDEIYSRIADLGASIDHWCSYHIIDFFDHHVLIIFIIFNYLLNLTSYSGITID